MPLTKVSFIIDKYGNYQDNWYTDNYQELITTLENKIEFTRNVNLGVSNGVIIENNFSGDFHNINVAIVEHDTYGKHLYKLIKKAFIKRDLWRITMVKDMVSSKYSQLLDSKLLVSRLGISRTTFDPLLFQKDILDLSEVKKQQTLLSELGETKSYGFIAIWKRDSLDGTSIVWESTPRVTNNYDIAVAGLENYENYGKKKIASYAQNITVKIGDKPDWFREFISEEIDDVENNRFSSYAPTTISPDIITLSMTNQFTWFNNLITIRRNIETYNDYADIEKHIGKVIYDTIAAKFYEIKLSEPKLRSIDRNLDSTEISNLMNPDTSYATLINPKYLYNEYYYELEYTLLAEIETISKTLQAYPATIDQPFDMFYIPIIENAKVMYDSEEYRTDELLTKSMLYDLIAEYAGDAGKLVDVQVIPYSPVEGFITNWNNTTKTFTADTADEVIISEDIIIPIYKVLYANYSTMIPYIKTVSDYKIEQKKKYVITSPSGATQYELSVAKNRGVEGFIVSVDIRPYSTFHWIQPIYKGLYGANYRDTRGLIWQEDTSLTIITSAWETYKRQNINYLNSFNADVSLKRSELALNQEANWGNYGFDAGKRMIEAGVEAATFAADAVAKDAWFGIKGGVSGGAGAAAIMAGAALTETLEAGQLAYNNRMDKKILENQINTARQQFNYNIGNIKAIPENIEKVNGVFATNNYVPYIQLYEPTEEEINYYNNYLDLYGVNIGMIVDLKNKIFNYMQGTIVLYEGTITNEEYEELHNQLSKGSRKIVMEG